MIAALAPLLASCEFDKVVIDRPESKVSMHAVLSATAATQVVLLERTRNGSVQVVTANFDLEDPIGSDEGIAESGALVTLTTPGGGTFAAREDNTTRIDRSGAGVYRFTLPGASLVRGGVYRLTVRTAKGETLTAETVVPGGDAAGQPDTVAFDRVRDTMELAWPAAPGARSYFVRVETPFGPRSFFTDSTRVRLTGELRNPDATGIPRVFFPGFAQAVTVSAVDSNYYDWYRTSNDQIAGTGIVSRVRGGYGVFGSLVRLRFENARVVAPQTEPEAGLFQLVRVPNDVPPYLSIELYVESRAARGDQSDALSGRYVVRPRFGYTGCLTCGLLGSVKNGRVQLALLQGWTARDTAEVFTGEIRGDTLVGSYRGFGSVTRFVRVR